MPSDLTSAYATTGGGDVDHVRDAPAALCVASHARDADDCALLLAALGLTATARHHATLRQLTTERNPR